MSEVTEVTEVTPANYRQFPGYLGCRLVPVRVASDVKVVRAVVNAKKQGLDLEGGRFYACCETHGTLCGFSRAREARDAAFDPLAEMDFCEDCVKLATEEGK